MAHRGASDLEPENSLAAFELAVEHGADLVETDLWFTADGTIICHHDATLERMTTDPRRVDQTTLAQLRGLSLPPSSRGRPQHIPTLAELAAALPDHVALMLELKDPRFAETERIAALVAALGARANSGRVGVITTRKKVLANIRRHAPQLVTGHIAMADPLGWSGCDVLGPYWPLLYLNPAYVRRAHARGQRVCPLDPDLHRRLPRYLAMDVDAVLTNDPRATRSLIEELRASR